MGGWPRRGLASVVITNFSGTVAATRSVSYPSGNALVVGWDLLVESTSINT